MDVTAGTEDVVLLSLPLLLAAAVPPDLLNGWLLWLLRGYLSRPGSRRQLQDLTVRGESGPGGRTLHGGLSLPWARP